MVNKACKRSRGEKMMRKNCKWLGRHSNERWKEEF